MVCWRSDASISQHAIWDTRQPLVGPAPCRLSVAVPRPIPDREPGMRVPRSSGQSCPSGFPRRPCDAVAGGERRNHAGEIRALALESGCAVRPAVRVVGRHRRVQVQSSTHCCGFSVAASASNLVLLSPPASICPNIRAERTLCPCPDVSCDTPTCMAGSQG